jgi:solute carrier family 35 protein F5
VVTIGLSLTIPLALLGSVILPSSSPDAITTLSMTGAALVFVGFGMLGWQGWEESREGGQREVEGEVEVTRERERGRRIERERAGV